MHKLYKYVWNPSTEKGHRMVESCLHMSMQAALPEKEKLSIITHAAHLGKSPSSNPVGSLPLSSSSHLRKRQNVGNCRKERLASGTVNEISRLVSESVISFPMDVKWRKANITNIHEEHRPEFLIGSFSLLCTFSRWPSNTCWLKKFLLVWTQKFRSTKEGLHLAQIT